MVLGGLTKPQRTAFLGVVCTLSILSFFGGRYVERMSSGVQVHPDGGQAQLITTNVPVKSAEKAPTTNTNQETATAKDSSKDSIIDIGRVDDKKSSGDKVPKPDPEYLPAISAIECPATPGALRPKVYNLLRKLNFGCDPQRFLNLEPSSLVLDIGSLNGQDAVAFAKSGKGHRVYTFEANPKKEDIIKNVVNNSGVGDKIKIFMSATSNETGTASFYVPHWEGDNADANYGGSADSFGNQGFWAPNQEKITVKKIKVDDVVKEPVLFMKIDTQGHEMQTLLGAKELITKHGVEYIRAEFWPEGMKSNGYQAMDLLNLLTGWGYMCFDCNDGDPPISPWRPSDFHGFIEEFKKTPRENVVKGQKGGTGGFGDILCISAVKPTSS